MASILGNHCIPFVIQNTSRSGSLQGKWDRSIENGSQFAAFFRIAVNNAILLSLPNKTSKNRNWIQVLQEGIKKEQELVQSLGIVSFKI